MYARAHRPTHTPSSHTHVPPPLHGHGRNHSIACISSLRGKPPFPMPSMINIQQAQAHQFAPGHAHSPSVGGLPSRRGTERASMGGMRFSGSPGFEFGGKADRLDMDMDSPTSLYPPTPHHRSMSLSAPPPTPASAFFSPAPSLSASVSSMESETEMPTTPMSTVSVQGLASRRAHSTMWGASKKLEAYSSAIRAGSEPKPLSHAPSLRKRQTFSVDVTGI